MRRILIEISAAVSLTLAAIISSATGVSASNVMIVQAFARASATPMAGSGAAYVSLMNHAAEADRLLAAVTPAAASAEIHTTEMADDVVKMKAAGPLEIPAMGTLEMKPGGYHIMLMGLKEPLSKGAEIEVTLTFEKAGEVVVKVPVGDVAEDGADDSMDHRMDGGMDHSMEDSGGTPE